MNNVEPTPQQVQKFHPGDLVDIDYFGEAIIEGSYKDLFGGEHGVNEIGYSIHPHYNAHVAWHDEHTISLIRPAQQELLEQWKTEKQLDDMLHSSLDWILNNWKQIRNREIPGATICYLMRRIGITEPWGSNGEGINYYSNSKRVMLVLDAALCTGDKAEVETAIERYMNVVRLWRESQSAGSQ